MVAVFTGKDFEHLPPLPCAWQAGGVENLVNTPRALEIDRVTHLGLGVAAVVAETPLRGGGRAGADRGRLGAARRVVDAEKAAEEGALQLHENAPGNIVMDWAMRRRGMRPTQRSRRRRSSSSSA